MVRASRCVDKVVSQAQSVPISAPRRAGLEHVLANKRTHFSAATQLKPKQAQSPISKAISANLWPRRETFSVPISAIPTAWRTQICAPQMLCTGPDRGVPISALAKIGMHWRGGIARWCELTLAKRTHFSAGQSGGVASGAPRGPRTLPSVPISAQHRPPSIG